MEKNPMLITKLRLECNFCGHIGIYDLAKTFEPRCKNCGEYDLDIPRNRNEKENGQHVTEDEN